MTTAAWTRPGTRPTLRVRRPLHRQAWVRPPWDLSLHCAPSARYADAPTPTPRSCCVSTPSASAV